MIQTTHIPPNRKQAPSRQRVGAGVSVSHMVDEWLSKMGFCADGLGPPSSSGVYVVTTSAWLSCLSDRRPIEALYVGRSRNIAKRVLSINHPYMSLNSTEPGGVSLWCKVCSNTAHVEIETIKALRPRYNVQHNG